MVLSGHGRAYGIPRSIRHASALALFGLWLLAASYVSITPVGLEWFVPLLYLKLLVSHLVGAD